MTDITLDVVMPTFYEFLRANEARFGLKWCSMSLGAPAIGYKADGTRPVFKVVGREHGTDIYVYVAVPLTETPTWLKEMIEAYERVLDDWDTGHDLDGITVNSVYSPAVDKAE